MDKDPQISSESALHANQGGQRSELEYTTEAYNNYAREVVRYRSAIQGDRRLDTVSERAPIPQRTLDRNGRLPRSCRVNDDSDEERE